MIQIGILENDMRKIHVRLNGFTEGQIIDDNVVEGPSGVMHVNVGITPRLYRGSIEIREHEPEAGFADLDFLSSVWAHKGPVYYRDGAGAVVTVIWESPFTVQWGREDSNYGTMSYTLREVYI